MKNRSGTKFLIPLVFLALSFITGLFSSCGTPLQFSAFSDTPPDNSSIILIIGDGMGFNHVSAISKFVTGSDGNTAFQLFPVKTQVTTNSLGGGVTDSAAAATAYATGVKVRNGRISMTGSGVQLETILEYAKRFGKSTGLVTTTYITHATPAAFGAHVKSRDDYAAIGRDLFQESKPQVLLGGGGPGVSIDSARNAGYSVVTTAEELDALEITENTPLFVSGQFGTSHMPYAYDANTLYPDLSTMALKAVQLLAYNPNGFFLMVEAGRIDHASHARDLTRMIYEGNELNDTVNALAAWAEEHDRNDVLIVVTADHETGGLTDAIEGLAEGIIPEESDRFWSTSGHTGVPVPLYAWGNNADLFDVPLLDNTEVSNLLLQSWQ